MKAHLRTIIWVGSALSDLKKLPSAVQNEIGFSLHRIQEGKKLSNIKPLTGLGASVLEITCDYNKNTYRAVYAVKLGDDIYVLHVFQKKSKQGIATPKQEIDLIKNRLALVKRSIK